MLCLDDYLTAVRSCETLSGRALAEFCAPDGDEGARAFLAQKNVPGDTNSTCMLVAVGAVDAVLRARVDAVALAPELRGPLSFARWGNFRRYVERVARDAWIDHPTSYTPERGDIVHVERGRAQHWFTIVEASSDGVISVDGGQKTGEGYQCVRHFSRSFLEQPALGTQAKYVMELTSWKAVVEVVRMSRVFGDE